METANFWKKPGSMPLPVAVQVILLTASSIFWPCSSIGSSSSALVIFAVQPAMGSGRAEASGWSAGKLTSSFTVLAVSLSFGTRKSTTA